MLGRIIKKTMLKIMVELVKLRLGTKHQMKVSQEGPSIKKQAFQVVLVREVLTILLYLIGQSLSLLVSFNLY